MELKFPKIFNNSQIYITLPEFLQNPTGKSTSNFASRKRISDGLMMSYHKLLHKYKHFDHEIFQIKQSYYFYFKIPSETVDNVYYDVVLEFYPKESKNVLDNNLNNYGLKFFSNAPSCMFTYTYVLNDNKILIDKLKDFCSKEALTKRPKVTNPVEQFGFEKSIFYACYHIREGKLLDKLKISSYRFFNKKIKEDNLNLFLSKNIKHQESKLKEYESKKKLMVERRKEERLLKKKNKT